MRIVCSNPSALAAIGFLLNGAIPFATDYVTDKIPHSVGISVRPEHDDDLDQAIDRATAMVKSMSEKLAKVVQQP